MISEQTDAIVLRMHPWSETSLIGSLFTREYGKVSVVAKGARRPKSPFEAALDLLSECRVLFISKSGDSLSILTEAKLLKRFQQVDRNLQRLYSAYYLVELLEKFTEPGTLDPPSRYKGADREQKAPEAHGWESMRRANEVKYSGPPNSQTEIFALASDTLRKLESTECETRAVVLRLELQLLRLCGHLPSLKRCVHCGNATDGGRWTIYSPVSGGVVCPDCSSGSKFLMRIPPSVCEYLQGFTISDWRCIRLDAYTHENRAAIRAMMTKTISSLLDQRLRLPPYLEELGR